MRILRWGTIAAVLLWPVAGLAKPIAPFIFCDTYPDAPTCIAGVPACTYCHAGTPPTRNVFGMAVEAQLLPSAPRPLSDVDFMGALPGALEAIEGADTDADGYSNLDEILAGTLPSTDLSLPDVTDCDDDAANDAYDVCKYDPRYVLKKVSLDFCGYSPTYEELQAISASSDPKIELHAALNRCLDSEFWLGKNGQLWQLAHRKIRPLQAIKQGEDGGPIPLGDYYDDYALFAYTQSDDHDARDVMLADYFVVRRTNPTRYEVANPTGEQNVVAERRAGLMTTRWNLVLNVMFTAVPRTAAAQAYRSFLGKDIARLEGLSPIAGEPVDYDEKGVAAEACAICHSTLDPLTYPFKNYQGLTGSVGTYDPNRIDRNFRNEGANITAMPEQGYVLGQPVNDLREWAEVAANSDEFAAATVMDYWKLLMGREPQASEQDDFRTLWQDLGARHRYRVEAMLHDLIETEAYGVP